MDDDPVLFGVVEDAVPEVKGLGGPDVEEARVRVVQVQPLELAPALRVQTDADVHESDLEVDDVRLRLVRAVQADAPHVEDLGEGDGGEGLGTVERVGLGGAQGCAREGGRGGKDCRPQGVVVDVHNPRWRVFGRRACSRPRDDLYSASDGPVSDYASVPRCPRMGVATEGDGALP